jgi:hypothetical protein
MRNNDDLLFFGISLTLLVLIMLAGWGTEQKFDRLERQNEELRRTLHHVVERCGVVEKVP